VTQSQAGGLDIAISTTKLNLRSKFAVISLKTNIK